MTTKEKIILGILGSLNPNFVSINKLSSNNFKILYNPGDALCNLNPNLPFCNPAPPPPPPAQQPATTRAATTQLAQTTLASSLMGTTPVTSTSNLTSNINETVNSNSTNEYLWTTPTPNITSVANKTVNPNSTVEDFINSTAISKWGTIINSTPNPNSNNSNDVNFTDISNNSAIVQTSIFEKQTNLQNEFNSTNIDSTPNPNSEVENQINSTNSSNITDQFSNNNSLEIISTQNITTTTPIQNIYGNQGDPKIETTLDANLISETPSPIVNISAQNITDSQRSATLSTGDIAGIVTGGTAGVALLGAAVARTFIGNVIYRGGASLLKDTLSQGYITGANIGFSR